MVRAIFIISNSFHIEPYAKYLAVHLLDKYMSCLFWELISSCSEVTESTMRQLYDKMSCQMKLVLASCLQIASKVDLYKTGLGISQIQDLLQSIDPERDYSKSSISSCELRILKSLDFRLPLCLPIHAVEIFLAFAELSSKHLIRDTCINLLDIAYLRHEEVFRQLHLMARGCEYDKSKRVCRDFLALEASAPFIGAAVVVCSNFFFHLKRKVVESLATRLASLIEMSPIDINIMANVLFTYAVDEEDFKRLQQRQL
ncbi:PREDICTED: uncharacterized protein LOC105360157 isoform X2 [Ceratosolen solmsi marchali]|nr:PREDICTED: uncharacterized protein LOC105360157 isoform X2 [Ceratosolen solmsi marchali]